jgi:hypothetical protein
MAHVIAQHSIPYDTGIPEDVTVNTWSFDLASTSEGNLEQVRDFLSAFYTQISSFYSRVINPQLARVRIYARADPEPRTPLLDEIVPMPTDQGTGVVPEEVAICFSFQGVPASGSPQARRRGRVYLGPFNTSVIAAADAQNRSRVATGFATNVFTGYNEAWDELTTAGNVHEVWSGASSTGFPVVNAWMDNAFDTQRRRGAAATARTSESGPFGT